MTYTAFLALAILRDDFSKLDRSGIIRFLRTCQQEDGRWNDKSSCHRSPPLLTNIHSFSTVPGSNESDLRTLYCAFAISSMLDDWSGINVPLAVSFISTCRVRTTHLYCDSNIFLHIRCKIRLMKADMANLLFVKRKVCAFEPLFFSR